MELTPTENRLYTLLLGKSGKVVPYQEIDAAISCKHNRENLRSFVRKLRQHGIKIQTVNRTGYRLKFRKKAMPVLSLNPPAQVYASEVQDAIHAAMRNHDMVDVEAKVAIIGVTIGAMLHQLPEHDREHMIRILMHNVKIAHQMSELVREQ